MVVTEDFFCYCIFISFVSVTAWKGNSGFLPKGESNRGSSYCRPQRSCPYLPACTVPGGVCSGGVIFSEACVNVSTEGGVCTIARWDTHPLPGPEADTPLPEQTPPGTVHAGRYGQQTGGTHPTGMHTCYHVDLKSSKKCYPFLARLGSTLALKHRAVKSKTG